MFRIFRFFVKTKEIFMDSIDEIIRPTKEEQKTAMESYDVLASALSQIQSDYPEIEIEETNERIKIPLNSLKLLAKILKATSQGKLISIVPIAISLLSQGRL